MTAPTRLPYPKVTQTPKPKQITGEKSFLNHFFVVQKCSYGCLDTFCQNELLDFCSTDPGMGVNEMVRLIHQG